MRHLFYDDFLAKVQLEEQQHRSRKPSGDQPNSLSATLQAARVHLISEEAVKLVVETGDRLRYISINTPEPPVLPLWIEFEGIAVGQEDQRIVALLVIRDWEDAKGLRVYSINTEEGIKSLFLRSSGWELEQVGPCSYYMCPLGKKTCDGVLYYIHQKRDEFSALEKGCACYEAGRSWAQIISVFLYLLSAEGVVQQEEERAKEVPASASQRKQAEVRKWNKEHPPIRYISLSLTAPVRVQRSAASRALALEPPDEAAEERDGQEQAAVPPGEHRLVAVRAHPRLLIPGPGKPWRPEKGAQVVWIRTFSYNRRTRGPSRTRYYVLP